MPLISTMLFSFARISAILALKRQDFYYQGPSRWLRFHEKGGKEHEMPALGGVRLRYSSKAVSAFTWTTVSWAFAKGFCA